MHIVADRAVFSALLRMFKQRRNVFNAAGLGPDLGDEGPLLELTEFVVGVGRAAHDITNGLKWGLSFLHER